MGDRLANIAPTTAATDHPQGATVVVRRSDEQYLLIGHPAWERCNSDRVWTPPAGNRRDQEPVLGLALRKLAETTGITNAHVWPVDLSGTWAVFATEVPTGATITPHHDQNRFTWLPLDDALARLAPSKAKAAEGMRRAATVPRHPIQFRPLTRADLPQMVQWQRAPHAELWFTNNLDLATAHEKYGPRIDGYAPVRVHVLLVNGAPLGFIQHYLVADHQAYAAATGTPEAVAIDYLIGDRRLVGRGYGPAMIWAYLHQVVLPAYPAVTQIVASPDVDNERSLRALDKAGFRRIRQIPTSQPEVLCLLDRVQMLG